MFQTWPVKTTPYQSSIGAMKFLSFDDLERLDKWVYKLKGVTILDSHMRKWWNIAFKFVPLKTSPDVISVWGFIAGVLCAALVIFYSPALKTEVPGWVHVVCAIGLFFYQTMDALDGKQCRRSGRSSGVEEIFDHGCDSVNSILQYVVTTSCFVLGHRSWMWLIFLYVGNFTFFTVQWRTYATGIMQVGKIDHTETQVMGMMTMLTTAVYGSQIWETKVLGLPFNLVEIAIYTTTITGVFKVLENVQDTIAHKKSIIPASTFIIGHILFCLSFYLTQAWIDEHDMLVVFGFFLGFFVAKQDQRIVIAHLVEGKMKFWDTSLIPVVAYTCYAIFGSADPNTLAVLLWACCVFSFIDVAIFFTCVTREMADHYGFEIFRLQKGERTFWDALEEDAPDPNNKPRVADEFTHND
uniref:Choline/ethanolaminephosphotransferase 1-like n=1 Tax=Phallusia mammillata TaxID=59560 RepID=A0A6F9D9V9_9ASCI|nr:choline/ethanolaminephosphotransferase 1-like [Phallusia mammillata]